MAEFNNSNLQSTPKVHQGEAALLINGDFNRDGHINAADLGPAMQAVEPRRLRKPIQPFSRQPAAIADLNHDANLIAPICNA